MGVDNRTTTNKVNRRSQRKALVSTVITNHQKLIARHFCLISTTVKCGVTDMDELFDCLREIAEEQSCPPVVGSDRVHGDGEDGREVEDTDEEEDTDGEEDTDEEEGTNEEDDTDDDYDDDEDSDDDSDSDNDSDDDSDDDSDEDSDDDDLNDDDSDSDEDAEWDSESDSDDPRSSTTLSCQSKYMFTQSPSLGAVFKPQRLN